MAGVPAPGDLERLGAACGRPGSKRGHPPGVLGAFHDFVRSRLSRLRERASAQKRISALTRPNLGGSARFLYSTFTRPRSNSIRLSNRPQNRSRPRPNRQSLTGPAAPTVTPWSQTTRCASHAANGSGRRRGPRPSQITAASAIGRSSLNFQCRLKRSSFFARRTDFRRDPAAQILPAWLRTGPGHLFRFGAA